MTAGQLLGLGLQIVLQRTMSEDALHSWAWRIPFIIGALGAAIVFYLRRNMLETEVYAQDDSAQNDPERGTLKALWAHRREAFLVIALTMGGTVAYYTYTTYLTKYLSGSAAWTSRPPRWSASAPCSSSCASSRWRASSPTGSAAARC